MDQDGRVTLNNLFAAFCEYCISRDIPAVSKKTFTLVAPPTIRETLGIPLRNDVLDDRGKQQRGWKGLICSQVALRN